MAQRSRGPAEQGGCADRIVRSGFESFEARAQRVSPKERVPNFKVNVLIQGNAKLPRNTGDTELSDR